MLFKIYKPDWTNMHNRASNCRRTGATIKQSPATAHTTRKVAAMRDLEFMWKTGESAGGECPALYRTDGGYVIQGKTLDAETRAALRDLGSDEDGVFVPADVIDRIRELG